VHVFLGPRGCSRFPGAVVAAVSETDAALPMSAVTIDPPGL